MPRRDGTGPKSQGPGTGRGMGRSGDRGQGGSRRGREGGFGVGPGGYCVCPNCGERAIHQIGSPCYAVKCPNCGTGMTRE